MIFLCHKTKKRYLNITTKNLVISFFTELFQGHTYVCIHRDFYGSCQQNNIPEYAMQVEECAIRYQDCTMLYEGCARWYGCTMIISLISTNPCFTHLYDFMLPPSCWHGVIIDPNIHNNLQCDFLIFIRHTVRLTLREKCPNTEFFLVWIQESTRKNSVFGHFSHSVC